MKIVGEIYIFKCIYKGNLQGRRK